MKKLIEHIANNWDRKYAWIAQGICFLLVAIIIIIVKALQ